jgi:hypothetical protein
MSEQVTWHNIYKERKWSFSGMKLLLTMFRYYRTDIHSRPINVGS